jgi:hypothetical protein
MSGGALDVAIDRLVLDGVLIPADAVATLGELIESELRRILDGGGRPGEGSSVGAELDPLILTNPPDVPKLVRDLAERIADAAATAGGRWDG